VSRSDFLMIFENKTTGPRRRLSAKGRYRDSKSVSALLVSATLLAAIGFSAAASPSAAWAQELPVQVQTGVAKALNTSRPLSAETRAQIAALYEAKKNRTPAQRKMQSALLDEVKMNRNEPIAKGINRLRTSVRIDMAGRALVDITVTDITDTVLAAIRGAGGVTGAKPGMGRYVSAWVPLQSLETLMADKDFLYVTQAAEAYNNTGSVNSQGDRTHRADFARATYGVNGAGVKIGVISDSYDAATSGPGELPGGVSVIPNQDGPANGTDEGNAMLEIVADLAPGAQLYFATAYPNSATPTISGQQQFANNIIALKAAGCSVIVDDVGYFDESPFGDAVIARAVNQVTAQGALYFSSAGNSGGVNRQSACVWEGNYTPSGQVIFGATGNVLGTTMVFNPADGTDYNQFVDTNAGGVDVFWSDPIDQAVNDYDIFTVDSFGNVTTQGANGTEPGTPPYETAVLGGFDVLYVVRYDTSAGATSTPAPRYFHVNARRNKLQYVTAGQTHGHSSCIDAFSVAAAPAAGSDGVGPTGPFPNPFTASSKVESFTSDGPRRVFYKPDGTPYTPTNLLATGGSLRLKPDITAADGVSTTLPLNQGLNPFFGTSAAAPHAAAIAALVKQKNPAITPAAFRTLFTGVGKIDIEGSGWDRDSGYGLVMADLAVANAGGGSGGGGGATSKWVPIDVATERVGNTSRLLWKETTNRYAVWKVAANGTVGVGKYYGPITGYTCNQIVVAPNGQASLFWKNPTTKQAALWTLSADLATLVKATVYNYPAGYTPSYIAADQSNNIRMTWRKTNNAIAIWTITPANGAITGSAVYGPYANLQDGPIAVGADGRIRLVWRNTQTNGATLWTIPATYGAPSAGYNYNPVANAAVGDIAVGADNKTRLQWVYVAGPDTGKIAVWKINTVVGGNGAIEVGKFYGPIADVSPLGLTVGGDNQTRQLWKYTGGTASGRAALWVLNDPLSAVSAAYTYGPIF